MAAVDISCDVLGARYHLGAEDELSQLVTEIQSLDRRAIGITCDVSNGDQVEKMVQRVVNEFGKIDILVNDVGIVGGGPITEMAEEEWDLVLAGNLKSQFLCCKYVLPHMIKRQSGKIINIGSIGGREGRRDCL